MKTILGHLQSNILLSASINTTLYSGAFKNNIVPFVDVEIADYPGNLLKFTASKSVI